MAVGTQAARILVVDDEPDVARVIARLAESFGHQVVVAASVDEALVRFDETPFDVVLTDLRLGQQDGLALLRHLLDRAPDVPVILITGQATIDSAMEAIRMGAYDYLAKPVERASMGELLRRALERRRLAEVARSQPPDPGGLQTLENLGNIAGRSAAMLEVFKTVARVAGGRSSVLILGESGTGKELVARALHSQSARSGRFVPVNVSAIPEGLLESELFGHVRGAFTGAVSARRGLFEEAHLGTLFLDEIGDLSPMLQAKLLRVIQEQSLKPVGGNEEVKVDVRIVAATHRSLEDMVQKGTFREDLYFRINVVTIVLPALRERVDDIPILIEHFLRKYEQHSGVPAPRCTPEALDALAAYGWPGNVRELENVLERAVLLSRDGAITPDSLPTQVQGGAPRPFSQFPPLDEMIDRYVNQVLQHTGGNRTEAARILGLSRRTLHRMEERKRQKPPED